MKQSIHIGLGLINTSVGILTYDDTCSRTSHFAYCDQYLGSHSAFGISSDLPLRSGWQTIRHDHGHSPFPWSFSDTEPDQWGRKIVDRSFSKGCINHNRELSAIDYLMAVDDFSRLGALRLSVENMPLTTNADGRRRTPTLLDLRAIFDASRRIELDRETEEDLLYLEGRGTSLGGARPKCSVINRAYHLCLGKFASVNDQRDIAKGEVLALTLAQRCGIHAAKAERCTVDGVSASIIERFDRDFLTDRRVPYLSASAFLMRTEDDNPPASYLDLLEALVTQGADWRTTAEELFRRILFNVLINNTDDHSRNTGLLMLSAQTWTLSPAFDINPVPLKRPSSPYASKLYLFGDEPAETITQIINRADYFGLTSHDALKLLAPIVSVLTDWRRVAKSAHIGMTSSDLKAYTLAFEHDRLNEAKNLLSQAGF